MEEQKKVQQRINQIFASQAPEVERVAEGFHWILELQLAASDRQVELLHAMGDKQNLVKEQIKNSTMQHTLKIFDECFLRATGKPWQPKAEARNE